MFKRKRLVNCNWRLELGLGKNGGCKRMESWRSSLGGNDAVGKQIAELVPGV
jgi:hypothetical protein